MKSLSWPCPVLLCVLLVVPLLIPTPGLSAKTDQELPPAELTGGGLVGDGVSEGFGDIVAPVFLLKSGLVFVNPRASYTDNSSEEYNLGVGYRHLLAPKNLILGANVYYDYRETSLESRFNQIGFGLEILGEWVDARANYYRPENKKETVNEYDVETVSHSSSSGGSGWGAPYATGNAIVQDNLTVKTFTTTTTKQHFEQFEEAMEGWDCELGVRLPIPVVMEYADVKVFGGYYFYNASFGDDNIEGFKGRLEIKALPAVYLDAEVYENRDLAGSDFFVGARMRVPFDVANISKGRNPFAGTAEGFMPSGKRAPFASRLTEMVMRDLHVRTEVSEVTEDVSQREETSVSQNVTEASRYTLVTNANFVDGDNNSGVENGTAEHPYDTINEGVSNAVGNEVIYVYDAAAYSENVVLNDGQIVWGSGCLIQGQVGMMFGSGIFPIVDGRSRGPTFTLANNTTLRGLEIVNTEDITQPSRPFSSRPEWGTIETRRVGVFADNVTPVTLDCNRMNSVQYGALLGMDGSFAVTLMDNEFSDAELDGVKIAGVGSSGTFFVDARRNIFSGNGGGGLEIMAENYDSVDVGLLDNTADGNGGDGVRVFSDSGGPVTVAIDQLSANGNGNDGLKVQAFSAADSAPVTVTISNAVLNDNEFRGAEVFAGTSGDTSNIKIAFGNIDALRNFEDGVETIATVSGSGNADIRFDQVNAISNGAGGIYADARMSGSGGDADIRFADVAGNDNAADGFYANAQTVQGGAYIMFLDAIHANGNGGSGIHVDNVDAHVASNGMALAFLMYVEANGNAGDGIWVGNVRNQGDAEVIIGPASANGNGGAGIQVDHIEGSGLDAETRALLGWVDANNNGGDGIRFSEVLSQAGPVEVVGLDVVASGNDGNGVCFQSVESAGDASLLFKNFTTDVNGIDGIYSCVVSRDGSAQADFSDISANGNGSNGINLAFVNALGAGAGASASFANVESSANSNRGIYAYVSSDAGPASANFTNVTANGNRADGIYLDSVETFGDDVDAEASFTDVEASGNGGAGVWVFADNSGPVTVTVDQLVANGNGNDGLKVQAFSAADSAPVTVTITNAVLNGNDVCGAEVFAGTSGNTSDIRIAFGNIDALGNVEDGLYADAQTLGDDASIGITVAGVDANNQVSDFGVQTFATVSGSGDVDLMFDQVNAISNGNGGIYADAQMNGLDGTLHLDFAGVAANDNASDGFYVNAHTEHGAAYVMFLEGIQANGNGGSGIRAEAIEGHLSNGVVWAFFDGVEADRNAEAGVRIGNVYCDEGSAFVSFVDTSASGNGGSGIQVDRIEGTGIDADTMAGLWGVSANNNGGDGICFSEVIGSSGGAAVMVEDVAASGNGGNGIYLPLVEAYGQDSVASVQFKNVTTDVNGINGIYSYVVSHDGPAEADFSDISANGNGSNGICLAFVNALGAGAGASASFANVESSANSNRGIYAYVSSDDGPALANFTNVTANGNRTDGIYLDYVETYGDGADAEANFAGVEASGNGGDGIAAWADAYGANGDAIMTFLRTTTHNNRGCGIYTEVYSDNSDAYLTGERVVSFSNRQDGVQIYTYAASDVFADFGNGAQGSPGLCSIYSNTVFNMSNTGPGPVVAQSNWWGSATPAPGKFNGNIDYANPLASDPNL